MYGTPGGELLTTWGVINGLRVQCCSVQDELARDVCPGADTRTSVILKRELLGLPWSASYE